MPGAPAAWPQPGRSLADHDIVRFGISLGRIAFDALYLSIACRSEAGEVEGGGQPVRAWGLQARE